MPEPNHSFTNLPTDNSPLRLLADEQGHLEAVLASMTEGLVIGDLQGNVLTMNAAALEMFGFGSVEEIRRPLFTFSETLELTTLDGRVLPLKDWPLARVLRGDTFSHFEAAMHRLDTGTVWIGSYGGTQVRRPDGEAVLAVLTIRDISVLKRRETRAAFLAEAGARLSTSLDPQTMLDTITHLAVPLLANFCIVTVPDGSGGPSILSVAADDSEREERARQILERYPPDLQAAQGIGFVLRTGEAQLLNTGVQDADSAEPLQHLGAQSSLCVPMQARGQVLGALSLASTETGHGYDREDLALAEELGRRVAAALDTARLFAETRARAEREALINQIGSALRVTLDADEIMQIITVRVGSAMGVSRCSWARLNAPQGTLETAPQQYVASSAVPATGQTLLAEAPAAHRERWMAGLAVVVNDGSGENGASSLACPVFLRGQLGGIFQVDQTDRPRVWTSEEVVFLSAVTDILALSLENARLYTREHRVADMLSSAFLTDIPLTLGGLALASSYRAGLEESRVGGDYYDAFPLADGRIALVIADVSGKGLNAAVQTATVKYSLRAFAAEAGAPSLVLTRLNRLLCGEASGLGDHFVTLFYAVYESTTGRLAWASAGHETVLIRRAAGSTDLLEATGPILGIADHVYQQREAILTENDSLVLYTDGLTEARAADTRALLEIERVAAVIAAAPPQAYPGALTSLLQQTAIEWTGGKPHDDMALLVARCLPAAPDTGEPSNAAPDREKSFSLFSWDEAGQDAAQEAIQKAETLFDFHLPSRAEYAAEVRQAVGHWMPALGFAREDTENFQTAVTEAVTNAVRHGSPAGSAEMLRVVGRRLAEGAMCIEVTDSGPGFPATLLSSVMPAPEAAGGRGLPLMQELTDRVEVRLSAESHCVILLKRPAPSE